MLELYSHGFGIFCLSKVFNFASTELQFNQFAYSQLMYEKGLSKVHQNDQGKLIFFFSEQIFSLFPCFISVVFPSSTTCYPNDLCSRVLAAVILRCVCSRYTVQVLWLCSSAPYVSSLTSAERQPLQKETVLAALICSLEEFVSSSYLQRKPLKMSLLTLALKNTLKNVPCHYPSALSSSSF